MPYDNRGGANRPHAEADIEISWRLGAGNWAPKNLAYYRGCAFRNAAQRRFVASMIALRPDALSFRFSRTGAVDEVAPACFLAAAHLCRWAAAILERAAADILPRFLGAGVLLSVALGLSKFRSSAICASSRFFCSSNPAIAAVTISVLSFVGMSVSMIEFSLTQK
jgi:hypothetical protein